MPSRQRTVLIVLVVALVWAAGCGGQEVPTAPTVVPTAPAPPASVALPTTAAEPSPVPPTVTPVPTETPTPPSPIAEVVAGLEGLPIDAFFEQSFQQLLLRSPETLTAMGIAEEYGLRNDRLDDLSDDYIRQTQELESALLELLHGYDRAELTPEQQVSYDVYEWYLEMQVQGHPFMYHNYPLHHYINSYTFNLDLLFTEFHTLASREDAEDYITRLTLVDDQVEQLLEGLALREERGVVPPRFIVEMARSHIIDYLGMHSPDPTAVDAEGIRVYTAFAEGIVEIEELSEEERQQFLDAAREAIESSFIPAYAELLGYADHLLTIASYDAGVWRLPRGDEYYAYLLRQQTGTDLTAEEIHQIGLAEVARLRGEMRAALLELGYPADQDLSLAMQQALDDGGYYNLSSSAGAEAFIAEVEAQIAEAWARTAEAFERIPQGEVVVIGGPSGGYYVSAASDGSRPGAYHVSVGGGSMPRLLQPSATYHETVPGHHLQIALAQEMDLPTFRNEIVLNGYAEGWALYAERLAWEMGLYEDDPYGNVGRLEFELLRAVRLVADTGIHAMRWSRNQAIAYIEDNLPPRGWFTNEVDRYVVLPGQATGYMVGQIRILELRQYAMDQLGDRFDLAQFHNVVLGSGSLPLDMLQQLVEEYVAAELAGGE